MEKLKNGFRFIFKDAPAIKEFKADKLSGLNENLSGEVAQIDVEELADKSNIILKKNKARIQKLPEKFQEKMNDNIAKYMIDSANRYDKDAESGLNISEFEKFSADMLTKIQKVVDQYAPTEAMIKELESSRNAQTSKIEKEILKKSREIKDIRNLDIPDSSSLDLSDPEKIYDEVGNYNVLMGVFQNKASKTLELSQGFIKSYDDFEKTKDNGWNQLGTFCTLGMWDPAEEKGDKLKKDRKKLDKKITHQKAQIEVKKAEFTPYENSLTNAPESLKEKYLEDKEKKIADLQSSGKNLEEKEEGSEEKKKKIEEQQEKLRKAKGKIAKQKEFFQATQQAMGEEQMGIDDAKEQLESGKVGIKDGKSLITGKISEINENIRKLKAKEAKTAEGEEKEKLKKKISQLESGKSQFAGRKKALEDNLSNIDINIAYLGKGASGIDSGEGDIGRKIDDIQATEEALLMYDSALANSTSALDDSIRSLEIEKLKNGTVLEQVDAEFMERIDGIGQLDEAIDDNVLDNNLALDNTLVAIDEQKDYMGSVEIADLNWWQTMPSMVGKAASNITGFVSWGLEGLADIARYVPVLGEYVVAPILDFASGVVEGAGEIVNGVTQMIAHPINAVKGMAALVGRDPQTGEWSLETAGDSWKAVGSSFIALDEFEDGNYAKGTGKGILNVVATFFTGGSAGVGKTMATATSRVARILGKSKLLKGVINSTKGTARFFSKKGKHVANGVSDVFATSVVSGARSIPGRIYKNISGTINKTKNILFNKVAYKKNLVSQKLNLNKNISNFFKKDVYGKPGFGEAIQKNMSRDFVAKLEVRFYKRKLNGEFPGIADSGNIQELFSNPAALKKLLSAEKGIMKEFQNVFLNTDKGIKALFDDLAIPRSTIENFVQQQTAMLNATSKISTANKGLIGTLLEKIRKSPGDLRDQYSEIYTKLAADGAKFAKTRAWVKTILDQFKNKKQQTLVALTIAHGMVIKNETQKQALNRRKIIEEEIIKFIDKNDIQELPDIFTIAENEIHEEGLDDLETDLDLSGPSGPLDENGNIIDAVEADPSGATPDKLDDEPTSILDQSVAGSGAGDGEDDPVGDPNSSAPSGLTPSSDLAPANRTPSNLSNNGAVKIEKQSFTRDELKGMVVMSDIPVKKGQRKAVKDSLKYFEGLESRAGIIKSPETGKDDEIEIYLDADNKAIILKFKDEKIFRDASDQMQKLFMKVGNNLVSVKESRGIDGAVSYKDVKGKIYDKDLKENPIMAENIRTDENRNLIDQGIDSVG